MHTFLSKKKKKDSVPNLYAEGYKSFCGVIMLLQK